MRCALAIALVALATAGCFGGPEKTTGGGLVAQELEILADDVIKGPRGVYVIEGSRVQLIDPRTGQASGEPIRVPADLPRYALDDEGAVWFTDGATHTAGRIAPDGVRTELVMPGGRPAGIAVSDGHAWVSSIDPPILVQFSKDGRSGEPIEIPCKPYTLVGTAGTAWGECDEGVLRFDTETGRAALIDTGAEPRELTATSSRIWALVGDSLQAIDIASGVPAEPVPAPAGAYWLAGADHDLWVAAGGDTGRQITRHSAEDATMLAGPVDVPGSTSDVRAEVSSMVALGGELWVAVTFYGGNLIVVRQAR